MAEVIIGGKIYTLYEDIPTMQANEMKKVIADMKKKEKKKMKESWKQRARMGYKKK